MKEPSPPPIRNESTDTTRQESGRILLVEDRLSLREMLMEFLTESGFAVVPAGTVQEGLRVYHRGYYHLLLIDLKLPDGSGLDFLKAVRQVRPAQPIILMTAYGTIEDSVQAMKLGAVDFIQKPIDLIQLRHLIRRNIEFERLQTEVLLYRQEFQQNMRLPEMISCSRAMADVARQIQKIAGTDATVLLMGESGTGKELFARTIHQLSGRRTGPWVEVNCAAIPETLMENELFGHMRGSYTGAESTTRGKFELASGGTLFLDEIGEMPLAIQSKLLKALEEKRIVPIGGNQPIQVDVRIVAATNRDLEQAVEHKTFRSDLYFRLAQFPLRIPPLRERPEDILPLARHFLAEAVRRYHKSAAKLDPAVESLLLHQTWPGNVRELKNLMERAVIVDEDGLIETTDAFPDCPMPDLRATAVSVREVLALGLEGWLRRRDAELEKAAIAAVRAEVGDDRAILAAALQISPRTLNAKLRRYFAAEDAAIPIEPPDRGPAAPDRD
ncbi:MAG: sigma-54-dependent Fis family transcriptional regulator [Acidobacteria bacterium]|nr:sigma-54-dependent Fis family transcriptional regulator [Acidobacteriota bacterium]